MGQTRCSRCTVEVLGGTGSVVRVLGNQDSPTISYPLCPTHAQEVRLVLQVYGTDGLRMLDGALQNTLAQEGLAPLLARLRAHP